MQNEQQMMQKHPDEEMRKASEYSLEDTAEILAGKYPDATHILMIHPSKMIYNSIFAFYDHYIKYSSDHGGCTKQNDELIATKQLCHTLRDFSRKLKTNFTSFHLCGFSKGSIVLNNLVEEFSHPQHDRAEVNEIFSRIKSISWIDAGNDIYDHYPTNTKSIQLFSKFCQENNVNVSIHCTDYTSLRTNPDVLSQLSSFQTQLNVDVKVKHYYKDDNTNSLFYKHFKVLKDFE
ncbi:hypothetical protein AKO1_014502 [Acrasis kona]|uniref:Uncharacterized protein n=1 Tax=Acrasis kona TaxID=1008807 RepID=A0AAW2Z2G2_9EUKA